MVDLGGVMGGKKVGKFKFSVLVKFCGFNGEFWVGGLGCKFEWVCVVLVLGKSIEDFCI